MYLDKTRSQRLFLLSSLLIIFFLKSVVISLELSEEYKNSISLFLNVIILSFCAISVFHFSIKEKVFLFFIFMLFSINFIYYDNAYLFGYLVLSCILMMSNKIEWKQLITMLLVSNIIVFLMTIPLLFMAEKYSMIDDRIGERLTYGFHNPNTVSQYFISFFSVWILYLFEFVKSASLKFFVILMSTLFLLMAIYFTGSRTGLLISSVLSVMFICSLFFKVEYRVRKKSVFLLIVLSFTLAFAQIWLAKNFSTEGYARIANELLSGRVWFSSNLISDIWPMPLFHGVNVTEYMPIDFFYIAYFYNAGLIVGCIFIYIFFARLNSQKLTLPMYVALIISIVMTFTENYFVIPLYNVGLFIAFSQRCQNNDRDL